MRYFDLHCDTLYEAYKRLEELDSNDLDISFEKAKVFDEYRQVFAVWTEHGLPSYNAYEQFKRITEMFSEVIGNGNILSVEGGSLLEGDHIAKLDEMKRIGIRLITLVWKGECCIGGAWDTDAGLSGFGRDVLEKMFDNGMIPDLAHASEKMMHQVCEKAAEYSKPVVNTHTASRAVCDHRRGITDDVSRMIVSSGGIVGITLYPPHIKNEEKCSIDDVIRHIDHFLTIGGEKALCIGADLDGVDGMLPDGIKNISDIPKIADRMRSLGYGDDLIDDIFFGNAERFFGNFFGI